MNLSLLFESVKMSTVREEALYQQTVTTHLVFARKNKLLLELTDLEV